jgi:hypothetical protein
MIAPEVLDALLKAGATAEMIVAAVKADGAIEETRLTEKRAKDAERQRRHRLSRDVTVTERDSTDEPSPQSPPLKSTPDPEKITPPLTPHPQPSAARKADPFPRPEWADPQVWLDLLANRRKKNLANTASAHRKLLADIERLVDDHWPPGRILEAAVSRGWGAIYAGCKDDDDRSQANRGSNGRMVGPRPDPTLELVRAAAAAQREDRRDYGEARPALPAR